MPLQPASAIHGVQCELANLSMVTKMMNRPAKGEHFSMLTLAFFLTFACKLHRTTGMVGDSSKHIVIHPL